MYDKNNVFAKMIRGEIPCNKVFENEYALSFYDINPICDKHVLVIPKGEYENVLDFSMNASTAEKEGFWDCFRQTAKKLGIQGNFNIIANSGTEAPLVEQSVFHFHLHLMAGCRTPAFNDFVKTLN